jgi:SWI/SNF chromatin-remodeling complex subunit SWI1
MFSPDVATASAQLNVNRVPTAAAQGFKSRREDFLKFVAHVMTTRQTPLPSTITGIPSAYDPASSQWNTIEPTAEPGGFRLAGKDVDLFKLWQLVLSNGGHSKVSLIRPTHFSLPSNI